MKKWITRYSLFTIIFICACVSLHAQINLVRNGSFEQYSVCPDGYDEVWLAAPWSGIDTTWVLGMGAPPPCLPDYCNERSIWSEAAVPNNGRFYQYPHTGKGLMQVALYYNFDIPGVYYLDYLQQRLSAPLVAGQSYCVTFFINMDNSSSYAINKIGAYFDDGAIDSTSQCYLPQTEYTPQVLDTSVIADTLNWVKVQGSFIAGSNQRFITIGNFFDSLHDTHIALGGSFAMYLIDDVSVIASDAAADAGPDVFTSGDTASIGVSQNGDGMPCYWYVVGGSGTPIDSGGTIKVHPAVTTSYAVSMDLCSTITWDTMTVYVESTATLQPLQSSEVSLSPIPAKDKITLQCSALSAMRPGRLTISSISGATILQLQITTSNTTINISTLAPGLYLATIHDEATGAVVTRKMVKE